MQALSISFHRQNRQNPYSGFGGARPSRLKLCCKSTIKLDLPPRIARIFLSIYRQPICIIYAQGAFIISV